MATTFTTIAEIKQKSGPDDPINYFVPTDSIVDQLFIRVANMGKKHRTRTVTKLGTGTFTAINEGYNFMKSSTDSNDEHIHYLGGYSQVDKRIIDDATDKVDALVENSSFDIAGMGVRLGEAIWYGDGSRTPKILTGLTYRFNSLTNEAIKDQVVDCGGTANLTSIWILVTGKNQGVELFHTDSYAGGNGGDKDFTNLIRMETEGQGLGLVYNLKDENGKEFPGYKTFFHSQIGMACPNVQQVVRLCNINYKSLKDKPSGSDKNAGALDLNAMLNKHIDSLYNENAGRAMIVMNKRLLSSLRAHVKNANSSALSVEQQTQGRVESYLGIPILKDQQIRLNEDQVT